MNLKKKLVWIFGTPRSGSTWLSLDILKKDDIKTHEEMMIGAHLGTFILDSRQGKFFLHDKEKQSKEMRMFRLNYYAIIWNIMIDCTNKAYELHNEKLRLLVKYEDLRNDPQNEINRIYQFLGYELPEEKIKKIVEATKFENISDELKGEDKNFRKAKPGGYKDSMDTDEIKLINSVIGENLKKFGYKL